MAVLPRHILLKSDAFAMMDGLRFLNFYGRRYSQEDKIQLPPTGLEYLPNALRYLRWDGFPSKSLPPSFRAEHLVELHLRGSKLEKLWTGVKDVGNLRKINLSDSSYLMEIPDLSMAKNLDPERRSRDLMKQFEWFYRGVKFQNGSVTKELDLHSPYSCPQIVISSRELLSALSIYSFPPMTCVKALPELPTSLRYLHAQDCASLETTISIINFGRLWDGLDFTNCFKLDQKPLVAAMHLKIQSGEEIKGFDETIRMVLPGSEIPEWFGDKGIGSSVTIQLPSNCHQLKGIAFCLVFLLPLPSCGFYDVYFDCHVKSKNDHMILSYELIFVNQLRKYSGNEVTFKFHHREGNNMARKVRHEIRRPVGLKSCGVYLHFDENPSADTDGYRYLPVNKQRFRRK
uniref:C-JID domain-containing protein n=1 Tax=Populus alba TaxID=43335 RepID=A0A4U5PX27_POPAL|nr:hypothetical protein D5086_0000166390 [Populus alba]